MTRGKPRRPGTRGGGGVGGNANVPKRLRLELPDDLPDAAEAALDDLLTSSDVRSTAEVGIDEIIPIDEDLGDGDEDEEPFTRARPRRLPSRVGPLPSTASAPVPTRFRSQEVDLSDDADEADPVEAEDIEGVELTTSRAPDGASRASGQLTNALNAAPDRTEPVPRSEDSGPHHLPPPRTRQSGPHTIPRADTGGGNRTAHSGPHTLPRPPAPIAPTQLPKADGHEQATRAVAAPTRTIAAPKTAPPPRLETPPPLDDAALGEQLVEERAIPELTALRFAVYEEAPFLASAQVAITECGHIVAIAAAGRDGIIRVLNAVRSGNIDVVLVTARGGESIIDAALAVEPRRPVIIVSGEGSTVEAVGLANATGADLATVRPHEAERIAPLALAAARIDAERRVALSAKGAEQVLRQRLEDLADAEPGGLLPFEMFQRVLELEIKRAKRFEYPLSVALFAVEIAPPPPPAGIRGILRARAGNALINTIRDIDIATQLDHERFLVLLPYTDLKGAASVGKRVIAAVSAGDPVVSSGRSFPPRVVGAVAGMKKGDAVSFAKLMKDATRALEQARRDGAELAVQP